MSFSHLHFNALRILVLIGLACCAHSESADPHITERLRADGITELSFKAHDGATTTTYEVNATTQHTPASERTPALERWEQNKFGAFLCYNTNQFSGIEFCQIRDPKIYAPTDLNVSSWIDLFHEIGMRYSVLTTRHTSGFLLWDSPTTDFDVASSGDKTDVVREYVDASRARGIAPGLYYCLWGGDFNPNPNARAVILAQLHELATNYGPIPYFWIDMNVWQPKDLSAQEIYNVLKNAQPQAIVICNQGTLDGKAINTFLTDIQNGESTLPFEGYVAQREFHDKPYYIPFEFEPVSQLRELGSVAETPAGKGAWFTYGEAPGVVPSKPLPADVLHEWIKQGYARGAANVMLAVGPVQTGQFKAEDIAQLRELKRLMDAEGTLSNKAK